MAKPVASANHAAVTPSGARATPDSSVLGESVATNSAAKVRADQSVVPREEKGATPTDELLPRQLSWEQTARTDTRRRWLILAALVPIGVGLAVLLTRWTVGSRQTAVQPEIGFGVPSHPEVTQPPAITDGSAGDGVLASPNSPSATSDPPEEPDPLAPIQERLSGLQQMLEPMLAQTGAYPPAVAGDEARTVESRLSWLALVAHRQAESGSLPVDWDSDWNAPVNDRFVRRRLVGFQNPLISQLTGEDGYPATHFVGLAGVGGDVLHPDPPRDRVGVFAPYRSAGTKEIRDGLAQTAVVTGVQAQLGSWGAGGSPTIRSFHAEPVIGGPDGFGTGTNGSLLVLMADGRVQVLSEEVDPDVFRQMLTIDGERPLVPGEEDAVFPPVAGDPEPGADEMSSPTGEDPVLEDELDPPLSPVFAGDDEQPARQVDPRVTLAQRILVYEQAVRPRREILRGVSELVGLPLRFEGDGLDARLREEVGFTLRDASVQQVLERTLTGSGLSWKVEGRVLVIYPTPAKTGEP